MTTPATGPAPRRRLLDTNSGSLRDAFGLPEWGLVAAIALMWGSSFLLMEVGLAAMEPAVVTMARIGLGAAALTALPRARTPIAGEDWPRVAMLGIVWMAVPLSLFPIAQQWVDSSVAGMINGGMPILTGVWAAVLLRRLPGWRQALGLVIGFGGIVAIMLPELAGADATAVGSLLILGAVTCYGLAANISVPLQQRYGSLPVLWRAQLVAFVLVAPLGLWQAPASSWEWGPVLAMLPLGVLGTGAAFALMTTLVGRVGGPRGSITIYFVPVVAIVLGIVLLGEQLHPSALVGTALVLTGAWVTSRRER